MGWNEGNAVANEKASAYALLNYMSLSCNVNPPKETLIAATGCPVIGQRNFTDDGFFTASALVYTKNIFMYQYKETERKETKYCTDSKGKRYSCGYNYYYTYDKIWAKYPSKSLSLSLSLSRTFYMSQLLTLTFSPFMCSTLVNSANFQYSIGHTNPPCGDCSTTTKSSPGSAVGKMPLNTEVTLLIAKDAANYKLSNTGSYKVSGSYLFTGVGTVDSPTIGDKKIEYIASTATFGK